MGGCNRRSTGFRSQFVGLQWDTFGASAYRRDEAHFDLAGTSSVWEASQVVSLVAARRHTDCGLECRERQT